MTKKPVVLAILDGYGLSDIREGNAVYTANTPNLDRLNKAYPTTTIHASGMDVGLPDGQMGNSEVGHTNIGAGRIVYQELTRITKAISDGDFYENEEFVNACKNCKDNDSALHIMGLLSNGGVHSHIDHIIALVELAKKQGLTKVYLHCFLDGRDVSPTSGADFISDLYKELNAIGTGKIATVSGRYYAMDRDNRWERVSKAYDAMVKGVGETCTCPYEAVKASYEKEVTDEFVIPTVVLTDGKPTGVIKENDSVIFANFRPDRAREITRTLVDPEFDGFAREYFSTYYVTMTQYDANMPNVHVAFRPQTLVNTLGEYVSQRGLKQLRIAETEKYAHVTFFFNGGVEKVYEGEDRILVASPKVATYDMQPEMSAYEVTDKLMEALDSNKYDLIILNYANCDMVGHTGVMEAAVKAVEAVDTCIGKVADKVISMGGAILITADHGNAEQMIDPVDKSVFTAHSTNIVPLIVAGVGDVKLTEGRLADLAPTLIDIMELDIPTEMTGKSLIQK
jgi:2,3-bisphosphoglycerate-independent phosphoglycerate mutase